MVLSAELGASPPGLPPTSSSALSRQALVADGQRLLPWFAHTRLGREAGPSLRAVWLGSRVAWPMAGWAEGSQRAPSDFPSDLGRGLWHPRLGASWMPAGPSCPCRKPGWGSVLRRGEVMGGVRSHSLEFKQDFIHIYIHTHTYIHIYKFIYTMYGNMYTYTICIIHTISTYMCIYIYVDMVFNFFAKWK